MFELVIGLLRFRLWLLRFLKNFRHGSVAIFHDHPLAVEDDELWSRLWHVERMGGSVFWSFVLYGFFFYDNISCGSHLLKIVVLAVDRFEKGYEIFCICLFDRLVLS